MKDICDHFLLLHLEISMILDRNREKLLYSGVFWIFSLKIKSFKRWPVFLWRFDLTCLLSYWVNITDVCKECPPPCAPTDQLPHWCSVRTRAFSWLCRDTWLGLKTEEGLARSRCSVTCYWIRESWSLSPRFFELLFPFMLSKMTWSEKYHKRAYSWLWCVDLCVFPSRLTLSTPLGTPK